MLDDSIKNEIKKFLEEREDVLFAFIFGSAARGKMHFASDIDIAIFVQNSLDLLEIGGIVAGLEENIEYDIDLVEINNLPRENPELAMRILDEGILLFCKNRDAYVKFKHETYLFYMDFQPYMELFHKKFLERTEMKVRQNL